MKALCAAVGLFLLLGQTSAEAGWNRFVSDYSGCSISYPSSVFTPNAKFDSDGGTRFTSSLPSARLVVAGGANLKRSSVADIIQNYLDAAQGETITYRRKQKRWAVYSGYQNDLIYYLKVVLSNDGSRACILELTYPISAKLDFDPIVVRTAGSLRLPLQPRRVTSAPS
jgi:hypothetical protein